MTATAKFWDGIAEKYAKSPIRDIESYEHTLQRTVSYLKPTDQVLELGCGTGRTALRLSGRGLHRTLRVARTIADMDGASEISVSHIDEALAYRLQMH